MKVLMIYLYCPFRKEALEPSINVFDGTIHPSKAVPNSHGLRVFVSGSKFLCFYIGEFRPLTLKICVFR